MNYNTKYVVRLSQEERDELDALVGRGKVGADRRRRAQILLKADAGAEGSGMSDQQVATALDVGVATVHRVRQRDLSVLVPLLNRFTLIEFKGPTDSLAPGDVARAMQIRG